MRKDVESVICGGVKGNEKNRQILFRELSAAALWGRNAGKNLSIQAIFFSLANWGNGIGISERESVMENRKSMKENISNRAN